MKKLFTLGIREEYPDFLNERIKLSNQVAFIMTIFSFFFVVQFSMWWPNLLFVPITGVVGFLSIFVFNSLGFVTLSRIIATLGPMLLINTVHAYLVPGGAVLIPQTLAMALATLVLPFILFDYKELKLLLTLTALLVLQILFVPKQASLLEIPGRQAHVFDWNTFLQHTTIAMSIIVGVLYLMIRKGYRFETQVAEANQARNEQYQEVENSRKEMENTLSQLEQQQQEEKKRNWATQGLSELNYRLRSEEDLSKVYDAIISWTVKYIGANQGNLYVLEEQDKEKYLDLKAAYAFNRKKYIEQKIAVGEGLVGQCYLEEEHIHLTEIPQNYIRITSGLGEANPDTILVVPMIVNEKVEGVMELATFGAFDAHTIDFIRKAGESIALTIGRHRVDVRTQRLLEESQEAAEQLRAQEEEVRQNMEELAALQEEMKRKEILYQKEIEELKKEKA